MSSQSFKQILKSVSEWIDNRKVIIRKPFRFNTKDPIPPLKDNEVASMDYNTGGIQSGRIMLNIDRELDDKTIPPDEKMDLKLRDRLIDQIVSLIRRRRENELRTDDFIIPFGNQSLYADLKEGKIVILKMQSDPRDWDSIAHFTGKPYSLRKWFIDNVLTIEDYYDLERTLITIM